MKRFLLLIAITIFSSSVSAKNLVAYFDYKAFYSPQDGNLIETYLNFEGTSVDYVIDSEGFSQAQIELTIIVKRNDNDIVDFAKKNVSSPKIMGNNYVNFLDQTRFALANGDYIIDVSIIDLNSSAKEPYTFSKKISCYSSTKKIFYSDIELLSGYRKASEDSKLAKSGYDLLPYFSNYYSSNFSELVFYFEVYNSNVKLGDGTPLLLHYYIEDPSNKSVVANISKISKVTAAEVIPKLSSFDISKLYTGTYNIVVEIIDSNNKVLSKTKQKIIRQNTNLDITYNEEDINNTFVGDISSRETINAYINSLRPIAGHSELAILHQMEDLDILRLKSFFYSFWKSRNADNPKSEWEKYNALVKYTNDRYGTTVKDGYETDMGRIYLKYGKPSVIAKEHYGEVTWPYEIWHYRETDYRFVFYSPQVVSSEYELLHSNVKGEITTNNWPLYITRDTRTSSGSVDDVDRFDNSGPANSDSDYVSRLLELYNNPR